jgi:hypothetical protein
MRGEVDEDEIPNYRITKKFKAIVSNRSITTKPKLEIMFLHFSHS